VPSVAELTKLHGSPSLHSPPRLFLPFRTWRQRNLGKPPPAAARRRRRAGADSRCARTASSRFTSINAVSNYIDVSPVAYLLLIRFSRVRVFSFPACSSVRIHRRSRIPSRRCTCQRGGQLGKVFFDSPLRLLPVWFLIFGAG
jgi:hypothetical protein